MENLNIEYRTVDSLVPYCNNARTHSDEQVAQIAVDLSVIDTVINRVKAVLGEIYAAA